MTIDKHEVAENLEKLWRKSVEIDVAQFEKLLARQLTDDELAILGYKHLTDKNLDDVDELVLKRFVLIAGIKDALYTLGQIDRNLFDIQMKKDGKKSIEELVDISDEEISKLYVGVKTAARRRFLHRYNHWDEGGAYNYGIILAFEYTKTPIRKLYSALNPVSNDLSATF